jgi:putative flippase GtrA
MSSRRASMFVRAGAGERREKPRHAGGLSGQLVRYAVVVGVGYLLAVAFYTGELDVGVPAYPAFAVVFALNGMFNFALLRAWAFPPSGRSWGSDLRRFCAVAVASLAVNYSTFAVLYSALELPATDSQRLAVLIAAPVTFAANRFWSFRARPRELSTAVLRDVLPHVLRSVRRGQ